MRSATPPPPYCCPYPCFYCTLKGGDLGNAAFHSAALYPALAPAIPPLVACLAEALDKTRSNAAGALGNLVRNDPPRTDRTRRVPRQVRNAPLLAPRLAAAGAVTALVRAADPADGADGSSKVRRVQLVRKEGRNVSS